MDTRFQSYQQVNVNTMNRGKIVVMLYSGAITFLTKAKMFAQKKDFVQKGKFITKAQHIIDELNYSLDMQKGQEIAKNLRSVYLFISRYLVQANLKNDPDMIDRVIKILETLKSAFDEIVSNPKYAEALAVCKQEVTQHAIKRVV